MKLRKLANKIAKALATEDESSPPSSWIKSGSQGLLSVTNAPTHSHAIYTGLAPTAEAFLVTPGYGAHPFLTADAEEITQMVSRMLPPVSGEGAPWQEKGLRFLSGLIAALCHRRAAFGDKLSPASVLARLPLDQVEGLYLEGLSESKTSGSWPQAFLGIKAYLDDGLPGYRVDKLLAKHAAGEREAPGAQRFDQDRMAYEQHAYRVSQIEPALQVLQDAFDGPGASDRALLYVTMGGKPLVAGGVGGVEAMRKEFNTWVKRFAAFLEPAGVRTGPQLLVKLAKFVSVCGVLFAGLYAYGAYLQASGAGARPGVAAVSPQPAAQAAGPSGALRAVTEEEMRQKAYGSYYQGKGAPALIDTVTNDSISGAPIAAIASVSAEGLEKVKGASGLELRSTGAPVYAFSNPTCSACQHLEGEIEKLSADAKPVVIPVAFDEQSMRIGTAVMCSPDPVAAWKTVMRGEALSTPLCLDGLKKMEANSLLFGSLGFNATPTVVANDGRAMVGSVAADTLYKWMKAEK